MSGNSLYDPDHTGIGSQAVSNSKMATLYGKYVVTGAKCECTLVNKGSYALQVTLHPSTDDSAPTTAAARHQRGVVETIAGPGGSSQDVVTLKSMAWSNDLLGKRSVLSEKDCTAATNANPNQRWYFVLVANDGSAHTNNARLFWKVTYYVTYFEKVNQS